MENVDALAVYIRSGSTLSLQEHKSDAAKMLPVRSSSLLLSRGPSYPCLPLDTSVEITEENIHRRTVHERVMTANPNSFRRYNSLCVPLQICINHNSFRFICRKKVADGPTSNQMELKLMQPLLATMHPAKDAQNIDRSVKYNYSILFEKERRDKEQLDTLHFEEMPPMEDFLRPMDATSPRSTGYESGHIRSLLKLDTYGPTNSMQATRERDINNLPLPNVDRYARLHPDRRAGSTNSLNSPTSSRASTAQSYASSLPRINKSFSSPELKIAPSMRSLYLRSSAPSPSNHELTMPPSLRGEAFTPGEQRVTTDERILFDPNIKRKTWHKTYMLSKKAAAERRNFNKQIKQYVSNQQDLAHVEKRKIRDFEQHLLLAKFE